jgi:hypothetical protein
MACLATLMVSGCSMFSASRRVDITPFAENTINLVAEINYGMDANQAVYLRRYAGGEPVAEYSTHWEYFRPVLRNIGIYSLALVTLQRSNISGNEKAVQLADLLDRMFEDALVSGRSGYNLTPDQLRGVLADIRTQKTLLDALTAAQPIVDEVARFSGEYLDVIKASQDRTEAWLVQQVDKDFEAVLAFEERAKWAQNRFLGSLALLGDYRQGRDQEALTELVQTDAELGEIVPDPSRVQASDLQAIEDRLVYRLARTQELKEQIKFDLDTYRNMTVELDKLVQDANNNLRRTRLTIFVWAAAHRRLAAGITDPAKIDLMGVAKRALDIAVPF